jgi:hypothetical protein
MSEQVTRFVEPCAGMLAVALRLRGGEGCVPPIAYMGGKRSFAGPILAGLGLASGSGARDVWVADAGPPGLVWEAVAADPDAVAEGVLEVARRFAPSSVAESRALYDRLRPHAGIDPVAWLIVAGWSFRAGDAGSGFKLCPDSTIGVSVRLETLAARAREAGRALAGLSVWRDARAIPVEVEGRTVVLLDPPYGGTTGYSADLPRDAVRDLAVRWFEAGAEVVVCEREAVVPVWRSVRVDRGGGTGGSCGLWERLTLSPNVRWRTGETLSLFGSDDIAPRGSAMVGGAR